jgi:cytochrome oxidase assembly protein ShyY1
VLLFAGGFLALGFWQYARHHEKQDKMRAARAAYAAPAPELAAGTPPQSGARVEVRGTYDAEHELLLRDQVHDDEIGVDVLTPLRLDDGSGVVVDRGWLPANAPVAAPPPGPVVVRGVARASSQSTTTSEVREIDGRPSVARVDLPQIDAEVPYDLHDVWVAAQFQDPAPGAKDPKLPQPPPPTQVNHMQYALQWWALALIPIIGWPIVLVSINRRRRGPSAPAPEMVASGTHQ